MVAPKIVLAIEALVDFIITGGGTLTGYMLANGAVVMPSGAALLAATIFGLIGAANQVKARMKDAIRPGIVLLLGGMTLAACGGPLATSGTAMQIRELAKIKDAVSICTVAMTPWGPIRNTIASVDKGMEAEVTVDAECKQTLKIVRPEYKPSP